MQSETENYMRQILNLGDDIKLAGAEIQLSEKMSWKQVETESYPLTGRKNTDFLLNNLYSAFLADTGGALGLFLGLSILQIFTWIGKLWLATVRWFVNLKHKIYEKRNIACHSPTCTSKNPFVKDLPTPIEYQL